MPAPARTELLSAGAVSGLKFRKSSFFAKNSCDHRLVEDGGNWRLSIDDIRNSNLVSCNASSLMKSGSQGIRFPAPPGAEDCSPGRKPWRGEPSPRLRHPSPAPAGEGTGVREALGIYWFTPSPVVDGIMAVSVGLDGCRRILFWIARLGNGSARCPQKAIPNGLRM